jgi:hypothetical protein
MVRWWSGGLAEDDWDASRDCWQEPVVGVLGTIQELLQELIGVDGIETTSDCELKGAFLAGSPSVIGQGRVSDAIEDELGDA